MTFNRQSAAKSNRPNGSHNWPVKLHNFRAEIQTLESELLYFAGDWLRQRIINSNFHLIWATLRQVVVVPASVGPQRKLVEVRGVDLFRRVAQELDHQFSRVLH